MKALGLFALVILAAPSPGSAQGLTRDVGPEDVVIFAEGDETQPVAERNATDLDERWL